MLNDKNLRYSCCESFMLGSTFREAMSFFIKQNGLDTDNIFDLLRAFNLKQKFVFMLLIIKCILDNFINIDASRERIYIVILKKIKIRINLIRRHKNA